MTRALAGEPSGRPPTRAARLHRRADELSRHRHQGSRQARPSGARCPPGAWRLRSGGAGPASGAADPVVAACRAWAHRILGLAILMPGMDRRPLVIAFWLVAAIGSSVWNRARRVRHGDVLHAVSHRADRARGLVAGSARPADRGHAGHRGSASTRADALSTIAARRVSGWRPVAKNPPAPLGRTSLTAGLPCHP